MSNAKKAANGAAQFIIGTVACANDMLIKPVGVTINETSNLLGASLDKLSGVTAHSLGRGKKAKTFAGYFRARHNADHKFQRVIDGRIPIEDYIDERLYSIPDDVRQAIDNVFNPKAPGHEKA